MSRARTRLVREPRSSRAEKDMEYIEKNATRERLVIFCSREAGLAVRFVPVSTTQHTFLKTENTQVDLHSTAKRGALTMHKQFF